MQSWHWPACICQKFLSIDFHVARLRKYREIKWRKQTQCHYVLISYLVGYRSMYKWPWLCSMMILEFLYSWIPLQHFWSQFLFLSSLFPFTSLALDSMFLPLVFNLEKTLHLFIPLQAFITALDTFNPVPMFIKHRPRPQLFGLQADEVQIKHLLIGDSFSNRPETISNFKMYTAAQCILFSRFTATLSLGLS